MSYDQNVLLLNLLDILRKHTDEHHRITQNQLLSILKKQYDMRVARRTVKNNMEKLMRYNEQSDYDKVEYNILERHYTDKETDEIEVHETYTDFFYKHLFSHGELRLMIDSILFSNQIPKSQRKELIEKIEGLSSEHFHSRIAHISMFSTNGPRNDELFDTIECLDEAITNRKQVSFYYNKYRVDEKSTLVFTPQVGSDGQARKYTINPYQMVTANGHYYLICNNDKYENLSHYRLDRITNIELLSASQKPIRKVEGQQYGLDLERHMAEHIYMFRGESVFVKLRFGKQLLSDFIDWFGTDHIRFSNQTEHEITASVKVNKMAMRKWALQYATNVRVLSPKDLVDEIKEDLHKAWEKYQ